MKKTTTSLMLLGAALVLGMSACKKKDSDPAPVTKTDSTKSAVATKYAVANVGGAYPSQTTYVQGLRDLSATSIDNSNARELPSFASMSQYGGAVYLTAFGAPATAVKYTFDANGKTVEAGRLIVPGANTFSSIEFISAAEAYASVGGGLARVVRFNPQTLQITGEVSLSKIQKPDAASVYYLGMKARDGKLFLGVRYFNSNFADLHDSAYIAVIDLASQKVEKLIADGRTSAIFAAGSSVNSFALDKNGDLYIQGMGSGPAPSGVLRIGSGSTDFDPNYFFNLKSATGKDCSGLYLFDGAAFTTQIQDPSDPYESNGPNYKYMRIDLAAKTSLGYLPGVPAVYGSSSSIMRKQEDGSVLFVVSTASENALYRYDLNTNTTAKKTGFSSGICTGFAPVSQ